MLFSKEPEKQDSILIMSPAVYITMHIQEFPCYFWVTPQILY